MDGGKWWVSFHVMRAHSLAPLLARLPWQATLLPALRAFGPDLIIVSAGFDGHSDDPVGQLHLKVRDCGVAAPQGERLSGSCSSR